MHTIFCGNTYRVHDKITTWTYILYIMNIFIGQRIIYLINYVTIKIPKKSNSDTVILRW